MLERDADYFYELQTQTGWGKTLHGFAEWCAPMPGWKTLDVGCGPRLLPELFEKFGCFSVGLDLDPNMFQPDALYSVVAIADVFGLPFGANIFDLITASNLLFLLPQPTLALAEIKRVLKPGGKVALLNPSERLNQASAEAFAEVRGLEGLARDTLLNWARRADANHPLTLNETRRLYSDAGLKYMDSINKVGPGFARFSWGTT